MPLIFKIFLLLFLQQAKPVITGFGGIDIVTAPVEQMEKARPANLVLESEPGATRINWTLFRQ